MGNASRHIAKYIYELRYEIIFLIYVFNQIKIGLIATGRHHTGY